MTMKLLLVSFILASFMTLGTPKGLIHCLIEKCGPRGTQCKVDLFSPECESRVPSRVVCIKDCKMSCCTFLFPCV